MPGAAIGLVIGSVGGSIGGFWGGKKITSAVVGAFFDPLETEDWIVWECRIGNSFGGGGRFGGGGGGASW